MPNKVTVMDLFSLYVLFSHFRPRFTTLGFWILSNIVLFTCKCTYDLKKQKENSHKNMTWSEMGKMTKYMLKRSIVIEQKTCS